MFSLYNYKKQIGLIFFGLILLGFFWGNRNFVNGSTTSFTLNVSTENVDTQTDKSFFSLDTIKDFFSPEKSIVYILIAAFLLGIITSFTPCVYPMIPITLGILQTQASKSLMRNFLLAGSYVLGISFTYAILGYIAATTTLMFGQWLGNPWVVFAIMLLFIYLAFSMFGFYEIKVPSFLTKRKGVQVKGSFIYSFFFGMVSGSVASPCLTPAFAILLGMVAKIGSPIWGFVIMFCFALGIGLLLLIVGTFSAAITVLPKSGAWMLEVKKFFGFVLLAMSVYLLQPFFNVTTIYKIYAFIALITSFYYFSTSKGSKIKIVLGGIFGIITLMLVFYSMKRSSRLLATNLKPDKVLVCLSTSKNQAV